MNRLDRALGILLRLRAGRTVSAVQLAAEFEVAVRTFYRDIEALAELGIPVYAEQGRHGGFRLLEGHFMPPVSFSFGEAMSLVLAHSFQKGLRVRPFPQDAERADAKLLAAMPEPVRSRLQHAETLLGEESLPPDLLHPEHADPQLEASDADARGLEADILSRFLTAIVQAQALRLRYRGPYHNAAFDIDLLPRATLWDRDRWYLIAQRLSDGAQRTLRADRALAVHTLPNGSVGALAQQPFDVRKQLGRRWLAPAMRRWADMAEPVVVLLTEAAARRLQADWYFRYAQFEAAPDGRLWMRWGEDRELVVRELLRWLGPEAELVSPESWRHALAAELTAMAAVYRSDALRR